MHPADDATLPAFVRAAVAGPVDERPVPELGLGDPEGAAALVAAIRQLVAAASDEDVVAAVARFVVTLGGGLTTAPEAAGALPLDLSFGTGTVLFATADPLSVPRMRLEQLLPRLIEDARRMVARIRHERELATAAGSDALTGLLSRRALLRSLATAEEGDVVVVIDVDGFKQVNDGYGHDAGDTVLEALGRVGPSRIRGVDVAGRYGGDEIVILLRAVPLDAARRRIDDLHSHWNRARPCAVSLSAGAAPVGAGGWMVALRQADAEMYDGKRRSHAAGTDGTR